MSQTHTWREALVRLCHLAGDTVRLSQWEQQRDAAAFARLRQQACDRLTRASRPVPAADVGGQPLVWLAALDAVLWQESTAQRPSGVALNADGACYFLVPTGASACRPALQRQVGAVASHLTYHRVIPQRIHHWQVQVHKARGRLWTHMAGRAAKAPLRVWIGHFPDGEAVRWDRTAVPSGALRALPFALESARAAAVIETLERAARECADIVVLPELAVDLAMRTQVQDWLALHAERHGLWLVQPGSWHQQVGEGDWRNRAQLLDGRSGAVTLQHDKLRAFGTVGVDGGSDAAEAITVGDTLQVLLTPLGAIGVLICKDFLDLDAGLMALRQATALDWALVPAYGPQGSLDRHRMAADQACRVTTGSQAVLAHIRDVGVTAGKGHLPGFAYCRRHGVRSVDEHGGLVELYPDAPEPNAGD